MINTNVSTGSVSNDKLFLTMVNGNNENCTTNGLDVTQQERINNSKSCEFIINNFLQGQFKAYSPRELGKSCSKFDVDDSDLKVWLTTAGNNEVCISDVFIDTVNKNGITRGRMCRFNADEYYNLYVQGKYMLPLSCN